MNAIQDREKSATQAAPASDAVMEVPEAPRRDRLRIINIVVLPIALLITLGVHLLIAKNELPPQAERYQIFLIGCLAVSLLATVVHLLLSMKTSASSPHPSPPLGMEERVPEGRVRRSSQIAISLRNWMRDLFPILAAAVLSLAVWETITAGLHWLPMPYFPSPPGVLDSLVNDRALLFDSTWHSLLLLSIGYAVGVVLALITGICIGWSLRLRYWGMPLLKVIGPIPATAWVPLAMVVSPSSFMAAIGLIALAVWFPVTMLTASGIANTKASYLDVARTLGAGRSYLIFRVAIPAAMPSIFIGLFMGLGTSFLTLIVAETVGVKSGLGWYVSWAQGWAEYGKVFAALLIMAAFFSTIMTLLFKVRDRVLSWQKGVIKW